MNEHPQVRKRGTVIRSNERREEQNFKHEIRNTINGRLAKTEKGIPSCPTYFRLSKSRNHPTDTTIYFRLKAEYIQFLYIIFIYQIFSSTEIFPFPTAFGKPASLTVLLLYRFSRQNKTNTKIGQIYKPSFIHPLYRSLLLYYTRERYSIFVSLSRILDCDPNHLNRFS